MKRFIAIAAMLLIALSTGATGMADPHRGGSGDMPVSQAAEAPMPGHTDGHGEHKTDRAGYHAACAIAGHSCAGYVTPDMAAVAGLPYTRHDWSAPSDRLAAGLNAEATTPPPRA